MTRTSNGYPTQLRRQAFNIGMESAHRLAYPHNYALRIMNYEL